MFGHDWFSRLAVLEGDRGAGAWLAEAETILCAPRWLLDIDIQADFAAFSHD
ncbi:MAG: hypothetical protein PHU07_07105 [Acidocella sp.]|nr:hypothetical protein [Acidocella sp.]